ncbi:hypothetical protein [Streptomyces sp. cg35]|uniref:hypothetical protein n=1 Tax=Streptomyces sp. cg35 TaxID=3421650 RepID=UPI003D16D046
MSGPLALPPGATAEDDLALRLARPPRRGPSWARSAEEAERIGLRLVTSSAVPAPGEPADDTYDTADADAAGRGVVSGSRPRAARAALRPALADDPVDTLAAELADDVGAAVHPYEVAALLEAQGMSADRVRDTYGHADLFSLAEDLFRRVPRAFPKPVAAVADPWRPDHARCALRGLLFTLPGAAYLLAAGAWRDTAGLRGLIVAALVSWGWSQALSHRAYICLVAGLREAGRALLVGAPLGAAAASCVGLAVAGPGPGAVFAAAQSAYLAAAGVLLVFGRERLLAVALTPVTAGVAALFWWQPPAPVRIGLPLLTLLLALGAAALTLRTALSAASVPRTTTPLVRSLPYGLFGLAAGTLTTLAGRQHPYAVVVLTLSMGPAEWLLHRYRGLAVAALRASTTFEGFQLRAARALLLCLAAYLVPLGAGALAVSGPPAELLALGALLWIALLLQAFGNAWLPAAVTLATAAAATVLPGTHCTATTACLLLAFAVRHLGSPTAHT